MKLYISADMEGLAGIVSWRETDIDSPFHKYFAEEMTKEVNAACEGAMDAGVSDILIKDGHDSARNMDPSKLPENSKILRGWPGDPLCMMAGIDNTFDAALFIGYHSGSGSDGNPLSHTMNPTNDYVKINGEYATECLLNAYAAAYYNVPVVFVSGDKVLCENAKKINSNIKTVAVNEGIGNGAISINPALAQRKIKQEVFDALKDDLSKYIIKLPDSFKIEVMFKEHFTAYRGSFYPGAKQIDAKTVSYESSDYMDILKFIMFVM